MKIKKLFIFILMFRFKKKLSKTFIDFNIIVEFISQKIVYNLDFSVYKIDQK